MAEATEISSLLVSSNPNRKGDEASSSRSSMAPIGISALLLATGFGIGKWSSSAALVSTSSATTIPAKFPRNSKYSATQFISFSINTLGGLDEFGECEGRIVDTDGVCYLGNKKDLDEDVEHRFSIVEEVLLTLKEDQLLEEPEVDHSPHVLKIFMLPEFFFRGPNGAYSIRGLADEEGRLIKTASKLRALISDPAFEDYLFVFGTLIAASSPEDPTTPWEHPNQDIEKGEILYFNLAPIYRGGPPIKDQPRGYIVPKQYISKADFLIRNKGLPSPRVSHLTTYDNLSTNFQEVVDFLAGDRHIAFIEDGILNIDGIRIGLEICLDHRLNVLWKTLQEQTNGNHTEFDSLSTATVPEENLVDIHLITSAGMAIERGVTPLRRGGVVYLTDGGANSAACMRTDQGVFDADRVCRDRHNDGPKGLRHVPVGGKGYSSYIELATCLNPDDAPWKPMMEGYYSNHATQGCAYTLKLHGIDVFDEYNFYPPSIEIYPTIALP